MENSPEMNSLDGVFKNRNGREITDSIPILITGTHQRLFFFSSRVGDGIVAPSEHMGNPALKTGAVFAARIEKLPPTVHYSRVRYQAASVSLQPLAVPKGVTIHCRDDDLVVSTLVRVVKETKQFFILFCELIGICFISKVDVQRNRPIFVGQKIIIATRRVKNENPSHWKVHRYELLDEGEWEEEGVNGKENGYAVRNDEQRNRKVCALPSFGGDQWKRGGSSPFGSAESRSLPAMGSEESGVQSGTRWMEWGVEGNEYRGSANDQEDRSFRSKSLAPGCVSPGRVTTLMRRLIDDPGVVAAFQKNDLARGTKSYERVIQLLK